MGAEHKGIRNLGSGRSDPYTNSETLFVPSSEDLSRRTDALM